MSSIHKILYQSFVIPFYRQIAGALMFLFFLLFGIQQSLKSAIKFHYAVIVYIVQHTGAFLILSLLTLLYAAKCISFFGSCLQRNEYLFISIFNGIAFKRRFRHIFVVAIYFLAPMLLYCVAVFTVAISLKNYASAVLLLLLLSAVILLTVQSFIFLIRRPGSVNFRSGNFFKSIRLRKNLSWFLLAFIFQRQLKALLFVKLISFLALYYFVMNDETVFEERMLWLILMLTIVAHAVIVHKNFNFLENEMLFYRGLPISSAKILGSLLFVYAIICLPEWWALRALGFMHGNWYAYACMITGGPLLLLLLHTLLYTDDIKMDGFLPLLFGICLLFFFFSFSQNKWLVPAVAMTGSVIVFYTSFRTYEKRNNIE